GWGVPRGGGGPAGGGRAAPAGGALAVWRPGGGAPGGQAGRAGAGHGAGPGRAPVLGRPGGGLPRGRARDPAPVPHPRRRVAPPGWLLRDANYVLSRNVVLGPWIHVESVVQHHGPVADGEVVEARATVTREWEHKGHRFVELDVGLLADEARVAAHVRHTAIYRPR